MTFAFVILEPQAKNFIANQNTFKMGGDASTACTEVRSISMTNERGIIIADRYVSVR